MIPIDEHPFPRETVEITRNRAAIHYSLHVARRPTLIDMCREMRNFGTGYGFLDNLTTGHFVPWEHERFKYGINYINCTNSIPTIFLYAEAFGLNPEICVFRQYTDFVKGVAEDKAEVPDLDHTAVIVTLPNKGRYLLDPLTRSFGPIIDESGGILKIGGDQNRREFVRNCERLLYYTASEYAEIIEELHEDGKSLDLMLGGEEVTRWGFGQKNNNVDIKIFYEDPNPESLHKFRTHLSYKRHNISDAFLTHTKLVDNRGKVRGTSFSFHLAEKIGWHNMVGGRTLANFRGKEFREFRGTYNRIAKVGSFDRLGGVYTSGNKEAIILAELMSNQSIIENPESFLPIAVNLSIRTMYEFENSSEDFLFSEEERTFKLREAFSEYQELCDRFDIVYNKWWLHDWGVTILNPKEKAKVIMEKKALAKKKAKKWNNLAPLAVTHNEKNFQRQFHRESDLQLFAKSKEQLSDAELIDSLTNYDPLQIGIGHAAIIADFLPVIKSRWSYFTMQPFMPILKRKVIARSHS
jgi:hypothetical protein